MSDEPLISAQVVLRRADGRSILDAGGPLTAGSAERSAAALPPDRIAEIAARLSAAGFAVTPGTPATLSIAAPAETFRRVFAMDPAPGAPARAGAIPPDLAPFVAEVLVTPPPTLFP